MSLFHKLKTNKYHPDKSREERIRTQVEKEDFLLSQIDEFREKAKQLQELVSSKESKVRELQSIVVEREGKAQRLQSILNERRSEADKLNQTVSDQVDGLIVKVEDKIGSLSEDLKTTMTDGVKDNTVKVDEMKADLADMKQQLEQFRNDLAEKVHDEDVQCYRNIQSLFDDFGEKVDRLEALDTRVSSIKGYLKCLSWFSVVNFIVLVGFILYQLGVFF